MQSLPRVDSIVLQRFLCEILGYQAIILRGDLTNSKSFMVWVEDRVEPGNLDKSVKHVMIPWPLRLYLL